MSASRVWASAAVPFCSASGSEQPLSVLGSALGDVIVGQREPRARCPLGVIGDPLQQPFRERGTAGNDVDVGQDPVRECVARVDLDRTGQRGFCLGRRAAGGLVVGQRQPRLDRRRLHFDGLRESVLGFHAAALSKPQYRQLAVGPAALWFGLDRLPDFGHGRVEVAEAGERVRQKEVRLHVAWVGHEHAFNACLGVVEPMRLQQRFGGSQLRVVVCRQQVRGADILTQGGAVGYPAATYTAASL